MKYCAVAKQMDAYVEKDEKDDAEFNCAENSKELAKMMGEIPIETVTIEYCPSCPNQIMEFIDKPPSFCCSKCGITHEVIDVTSPSSHDKEGVFCSFFLSFVTADHLM